MKLLKQKEYEYMLNCKIKYERFIQQKYWFSEWKQLNPLFEWIEGKTSVGDARDQFRELCAESLGYSLQQIRKLQDKLRITEKKLDVVTEVIATASELKNKVSEQNKLLSNGVVVEQDEYKNMVEVIRDIVADIETPYRLGVIDRINPDWDALNRAKRLIIKWDEEKIK